MKGDFKMNEAKLKRIEEGLKSAGWLDKASALALIKEIRVLNEQLDEVHKLPISC